jgi:replicative DNA helicase
MEYLIIALLGKRENYDRFARFVRGLTKEMTLVLKDMGQFFKDTGRSEVDWEVFGAWFHVVKHPSMDSETVALYNRVFETLQTTTFKEEDTLPLVHSYIDRSTCEEIQEVAARISEGHDTLSVGDIRDLLERRDLEVGDTSHVVKATWGKPLVSTRGTLKWRLKEMNDALGPVGEDLIVIGSRPDGGKTTFLASEVTYMASQLPEGEVVKWYINEESMTKVQWRIVQAALGWTTEEVEDDWVSTWAEYKKALGGNTEAIELCDCSGWTTRMVEQDIASSPTGLVVIDQLRKVGGYDSREGSEATRQELLYNWARDVAKVHSPVVVVHQASGDAEGERWIGMSSLHGSKTGIQGEADALITIGQDPALPDSRFLYVPKNKMRGDDPLARNGKFEVTLDKFRARFTGEKA